MLITARGASFSEPFKNCVWRFTTLPYGFMRFICLPGASDPNVKDR